jgi:CRISPR-associated protein Csd1
MLPLLMKYAVDNDLVKPPGLTAKEVRWALVFDKEGRFLDAIELGDAEQKRNPGRRFNMCPELSFSDLKSGGETKCHFLVETAEVVALYGDKAADEKPRAKHAYFVALLQQAAAVMPELGLLAEALADSDLLAQAAERLKAKKARPTEKVTLCVDGRFPVESDAWRDWWQGFRRQLNPSEIPGTDAMQGAQMRCLASGELVTPIATLPKITGLSDVGGLSMGDALSSYKQDSFCSYGLEQSTNAAISEQAAYACREALNHLIRNHSQRLAGAKVVHWFKEKVADKDDPLPFLMESPEQQKRNAQQLAKELLDAIRSGKRPDLANNYYYALTLSGASGRVMIRDWMEGQFEQVAANVAAWFDDLTIVRRDGADLATPPKFFAVLGSLARELDDLSPPFVARMWRVAAAGEVIPEQAHIQALARARIDFLQNESPNHARMGLLKAYHVRKGDTNMTAYLNEEHPDSAYHSGRLMAVLADLQYKALGDVGAGVVQRYYAAASSTPALVLGRLVRLSQFHLGKLGGGYAHWYQLQYLTPIWTHIKDSLPKSLTPQRQSLFALGYYHQMAKMAADRAQKPETTDIAKESNHD